MARLARTAVAVLIGALALGALPARALELAVGGGMDAPWVFGFHGTLRVSGEGQDTWGGRLRLHLITRTIAGGPLGGGVELTVDRRYFLMTEGAALRPFLAWQLGAGVWNACTLGDFCGTIGPVAGGQAGLRLLGDPVGVDLSVELTLQAGAANWPYWVMWFPSATLALAF